MNKRIMSKMKLLLITFISVTCFSGYLKAQQTEPNCGVLVDGMLVDSVTSWGYGDLSIVFPIDEKWKKFDLIVFNLDYRAIGASGDIYDQHFNVEMNQADFADFFSGADYGAWNLFAKGKALSLHGIGKTRKDFHTRCLHKMRYSILTSTIEEAPANKYERGFHFSLGGYYITSYEEKYSSSSQSFVKSPVYGNAQLLFQMVPVPVRTCYPPYKDPDKYKTSEINNCRECNALETAPPYKTGKKAGYTVEKVNYDGKYGKIVVNTGSTPAISSIAKIVLTTTIPINSSAVKPLDKTKTGYFAERSEDKKNLYREGYQSSPGTYHGEVREYDNNKLEKIIIYTNGLEDGLYVSFDATGKVEWSGGYKNGQKEGIWKKYKGGQIEESTKYVNGEEQE